MTKPYVDLLNSVLAETLPSLYLLAVYAFPHRFPLNYDFGALAGGLDCFSPVLSLLTSAFALLIPPARFSTHLHRLTERSPTT